MVTAVDVVVDDGTTGGLPGGLRCRGTVVAVGAGARIVVVVETVVEVDTAATDVVVTDAVVVVVELTRGAGAIVVADGATGFGTARLTNWTWAEVAGGPPTTRAPAQTAETPIRPPQARHARRACCFWRERSTSGSSTNEPTT